MAYDTDAQAWFSQVASLGPGFTTPWKNAGNQLILDLKSASLFSKLTALYPFNVEQIGQEVVNAVAPATLQMTSHGTLALTADTGIASDGTSGYYDTNFAFTSASPFSVGTLIASSPASQPSLTGDLANASMICDIIPSNGGTTAVVRLGMTNSMSWANTSSSGHFAVTRAGNAVVGYQNGVQKATASAANFALTSGDLLWMRRQNTYTKAQFGAAWLAQATLTGTEIAALDTALKTFAAAVLAPPAFQPSDLPGLVSWYDAQDAATITQSAGNVSQWNDKSPSGANVSQATGANRPTYTATGFPGSFPGIDFSAGSNVALTAATSPLGTTADFTMFVVADSLSAPPSVAGYFIDYGASSGSLLALGLVAGNNAYYYQTDVTPAVGAGGFNAVPKNAAAFMRYERDAVGTVTVYTNGTPDSYGFPFGAPSYTAPPGQLAIGNLVAGGNNIPAIVGELLCYSPALNSTEISQVQAYLAAKWSPASPQGAATGSSTATAVGRALGIGSGASSGTSTAAAVGSSIARGTGSASGASSVSGAGRTIKRATGSASGASTASATGRSVAAATGAAAGVSSGVGHGVTLKKASGAAAGASTASAIGQSVTTATGAAAGSSISSGKGQATASGAGHATGTSSTTAVGKSTAHATGQAAGASDAMADGTALSVGSGAAAGTSTTEANGEAITTATGSAAGTGSAASTGKALAIGTGTAAGASTATSSGRALHVATDRRTRHGAGRIRTVSGRGRRRLA